MRVGIGLGVGFLFGAGAGGAVNTAVPTIDSINYPGGAYTVNSGSWTGQTSLALMMQSSADGISGWTDEASYSVTGDWLAANELDYMRVRITAQPGSVVAYSAVLQLGAVFDQILDFAGASNWINHTVTPSFLSMSAGDGVDFWLMTQWFKDENSPGDDLVSIGNTAVGSTEASLLVPNTLWREGGANGSAILDVVRASGAHLTTGRFRNSGANHGSQIWVNDQTTVGNLVSGTIALTNFTTLRIGALASNVPNTFNQSISWVAFGKGNPAAAHAWIYNANKQRRADAYNWAGDPNGATLEGFILLSRKNPGNTTYTVGNTVDSVGGYDTWTQNGSLVWKNRLPGFIDSSGVAPTTPVAFISPKYATTADTTLTIGINTKNIGDALAGDLTITTLTHSVAGNIAGTVTADTFPNPGVGTITGTINGVAVACEIIVPRAIPANPQFWSRYNENALVAAIEEYPTYGAGTTYGNIAAMEAGVLAMGAGTTLTIENLTQAGTFTIPARDYGGATIQCRFRHGVAINNIVMNGARNLTIRGFSALTGGIEGSSMLAGTVTLDHCTGTRYYFAATTGSDENFTVTNWIGPEDGSAIQSGVGRCNVYTINGVAHGAISASSADAHRSDQCNVIKAQRFWFGDVRGTNPEGHYDCWQTFGSGTTGITQGYLLNGVVTDRNLPGETTLSGGIFLTGINAQNLRLDKVAAPIQTGNDIAVDAARQDVTIENTTAGTAYFGTSGLSFSSLANNNVKGSAGAILGSLGVETNTYASTAMATQYPDWTTYQDSWRRLRNPTAPFDTRGAFALIAELEAKRLTL
jgi:hypothetical protein